MNHPLKKIKFYILMALFVFTSLSFTPKTLASEYIISVFDTNSSKSLTSTGFRILFCRSLFSSKSISPSVVRVQRTASFSVHSGVRRNEFRGMQLQERSVEEFENISNVAIHRILFDWKKTGKYDDLSLQKIFDLHRRLSHHRLKLITVEGVSADRPFSYLDLGAQAMKIDTSVSAPDQFSALRIYDSSPVMKSFGRKYSLPREDPAALLELTERVFPDFHLTEQ